MDTLTATRPTRPLCIGAADAAAMLGISRALFYAMASDGRLGPLPLAFGRRRVWRLAELQAWVANDPPCPPRAVWQKEGGGRCM